MHEHKLLDTASLPLKSDINAPWYNGAMTKHAIATTKAAFYQEACI